MIDVESGFEPALAVSHVADFYRRYPGETVTLLTRVDVRRPVPGFRLQIGVPDGVAIEGYAASANHGSSLPDVAVANGRRYLIWEFEGTVQPGERYEYELRCTVAPAQQDLTLESQARAVALRSEEEEGPVPDQAVEWVSVAVMAKSGYLRHLPGIYAEEDEFMGRFLMLFESFWSPIDKQIDGLYNYFDPRMAPAGLLPWLASWTDLKLDSQWPEDRRRELVRNAYQLFRKRGTRQGLQAFLEIYTGVRPVILEHRANDFRLGAGGRLGSATALGTQNRPHTFTVVLRLPPEEGQDEAERARRAAERRRTIAAIIEAEKPAHTGYTLRIETVQNGSEPIQGSAAAQRKDR